MRNVGDTMSHLEPGATYIYERADGVTYARKVGDDPATRFPVGYNYKADDEIRENRFWYDVRCEAKKNPALQDAIDRVKLIYTLSKKDDPLFHHPV